MNDPKKLFVISAITREQIAELLNEALDCCGPEGDDGIDRFTSDDPRLTNENCQAIADRLKVGLVHVNDQTVNDDVSNPFGGCGASGNHTSMGGPADLSQYTQWRWITVKDQPTPYPF